MVKSKVHKINEKRNENLKWENWNENSMTYIQKKVDRKIFKLDIFSKE